MPQPFASLSDTSEYGMGVNILSSNSRAACIVADCITTWSYFEVQLGCILGVLLGSNTDAAMEIFMSLRKSGKQVEVLEIAGKHSPLLTITETRIRFKAILRVFQSLEKARNRFAHGCFGGIHSNPNIVLWCEAKDYVLFMSTIVPKVHSGQVVTDSHRMLLDRLMVYTIQELEKIRDDMKNIEEMANVYYCHLLNPDQRPYIEAVERCSVYPIVKDSMDFIRGQGGR